MQIRNKRSDPFWLAVAWVAVGLVQPAQAAEAPAPEVTVAADDHVYPYLFESAERTIPASATSGSVEIYLSDADPRAAEAFVSRFPYELSTPAPWLEIDSVRVDTDRGVLVVAYSARENPLDSPRAAVVSLSGPWRKLIPGALDTPAPKITLKQASRPAAKGAEIRSALLGETSVVERRRREAVPVIRLPGEAPLNAAPEEREPKGAVSVGAVVSAASFRGPVSPGQLAAIFGSDMANGLMGGAGLPLPRDFQGTRVEIAGIACPLLFVRSDQINIQVPMEVPLGNQEVRLFSPFGSATARVDVVAAAPELFRVGSSNLAIFQRSNGDILSPSNRARKGEPITFYGTGIGPVTPAVPSGFAALGGSALSRAASGFQLLIGGLAANVSFVGLTPGLVGLMQINAEVPPNVGGGAAVPVFLTIAGQRSTEAVISVEDGGTGGGGGGGGGGAIFPLIQQGQTIDGALTTSDARMMIDGLMDRYADHYRLELGSEQLVTITHRSSSFDAWLNLYVRDGARDLVIGFDDDSGGGLDSQISATLPAGIYTIEASSVFPNATGAYRLAVTAGGGGGGGGPAAAPVIDNFSADSTSLSAGQQTTLRWSVRNATDVSISGGIGSVAASGSIGIRPSSTTTYTLTARGAGGTRTSSVTVTVATPQGNPVSIQVTNRLRYPVNISVNGSIIGSVPANDTASQNLGPLSTLSLSYELVRPTLGGTPLGDPISGFFNTINNPSGTITFRIDNRFDNSNTAYFQPLVSNNTSTVLLMEVNGGLQSQNRCGCTVPAFQQNTQFGYYRLFTNSNVRAYRDGSGYTGRYIYWGEDPSGVRTRITDLAENETGVVRLRADSAP